MRWISFTLTLCLALWSMTTQGAVPDRWKKTAFAYDARQDSLRDTLAAFAKNFGVKLDMGQVSGTVDGKVRADSAVAYLDRLALEYQFLWFVYNGTLYISPLEDQTSASLEVSEDAVADLKEALTQIGLLDKRFGWGELPDEGVVIVSGPTRYVNFIKKLSKKKKKGEEKLEVMVFPLKYALADDREIKFRDKTIRINGVATMLSELLGSKKQDDPLSVSPTDTSLSGSLQALSSMQNLAETRIQNAVDNKRMSQAELNMQLNQNKHKNSTVSADTRNNAILIRDDYSKKDMYRRLIHKLDQPRSVVEIDAIILDIDKNKLDELGINWQAGAGSTEASFNASGNAPFLANGTAATVLIQDFHHFFAQIRALESAGEASLVSNPSILTIENQPAVIDFNNTAYIRSVGERVANVSSVTAGTSLQVIPRLIGSTKQKLIQLSLDIEDGNIDQKDNSDLPSVRRGTISTQAIIRTNRSLIVGGFKVTQNSQQNNKVPLLGDIPGVGNLFSYKKKSQSNQERLFIITPRLVGTEMNPLEYVSEDGREALAKAMQKKKSLNISRVEVERALGDLSSLYVPEGFSAKETAPQTLNHYCRAKGNIEFSSKNLQWYQSKRFALLVGMVENQGAQTVRFDEASCSHRDTLAVAVRPDTLLSPGASSEIMLAVRLPETNRVSRTSLLKNQTPTTDSSDTDETTTISGTDEINELQGFDEISQIPDNQDKE
ncbi:type III secretion system outer membrane ring subunit SctC [Vibrio mangrovi]|uniref:Type 3 secretion system secretin n=1 Tax=Vibrio mangrovi TaxID=474394 RepID=A0A1Y6IXR2_9VIBR|nr:type III secretion system outer membrane ring subunit SctC [Vibrio mangrovi]MDW6001978.1 type III secretion system outer membrane ring subunit SctC [Vibrio mangrovi]SMS02475.1 Type III secretion system outer membrane protein SpiA precursor [Vibrio mangrovi]